MIFKVIIHEMIDLYVEYDKILMINQFFALSFNVLEIVIRIEDFL